MKFYNLGHKTFETDFSNPDYFHPRTTEIQPFKVGCFSTRTVGFLFAMWNKFVMSYLCAKFYCDTAIITCNTCFFRVCVLYFSTSQQRFQNKGRH